MARKKSITNVDRFAGLTASAVVAAFLDDCTYIDQGVEGTYELWADYFMPKVGRMYRNDILEIAIFLLMHEMDEE